MRPQITKFNGDSAFKFKRMVLKLYGVMLDRRLHDCSIWDYPIFGSVTHEWCQGSKHWITVAPLPINSKLRRMILCKSLHDGNTSGFWVSGNVIQKWRQISERQINPYIIWCKYKCIFENGPEMTVSPTRAIICVLWGYLRSDIKTSFYRRLLNTLRVCLRYSWASDMHQK